MHQLQKRGADVRFHDPYCSVIADDGHTEIVGLPMQSVALSPEIMAATDAVVLVTDHDDVDYNRVAEHARLVVDARGRMRATGGTARIVGLSGREARAPNHVHV
jgi:UDP-N-acetyl-D-glucosamine dehydrogenase